MYYSWENPKIVGQHLIKNQQIDDNYEILQILNSLILLSYILYAMDNSNQKNPTQPSERCATQKCANSMSKAGCAIRSAQPQMVVKQWLCRN